MDGGMFGEEVPHELGLVRREIVGDDMDFLAQGLVDDDIGEEGDEFSRSVSFSGLSQNLTRLGIESGVQRQRAVAVVLEAMMRSGLSLG